MNLDKEFEVINQKMYRTKKYDMLQNTVIGNRDYSKYEFHIKKLMNTIKDFSLCPLLVTMSNKGELILIDGQHRLEAARRTNNYIYFIFKPNLTTNEVLLQNKNRKNWTGREYIEYYAKNGNQNYVILLDYINKYRIPINLAAALLNDRYSKSKSKPYSDRHGNSSSIGRKYSEPNRNQNYKEGHFIVNSINRADIILQQFDDFPKENITNRITLINAIEYLSRTVYLGFDKYDHEKMVQKLKLYSSKFTRQITSMQYVKLIEDIMNYHTPDKNKVRFL